MTDASPTLAEALVAFQGEITDVSKSSTATIQPRDKSKQAFGFPYADLAAILAHVRPIATKHGLAIVQDVESEGDEVRVRTDRAPSLRPAARVRAAGAPGRR